MNYEDMSDFEINKLIATHESLIINDFQPMAKRATGSEVRVNDIVNCWGFNPCNNPSDAWPIIVENKISISHIIALYRADALVYDKKFDNGFKIFKQDSQLGDTSSRGALRAAMICFLKMKDAENEK
ncbi:coil containing protein [Vibrio phage 1.213.O._10N.222.54.F10]|nr:coil containing protein [Vibrio phage 1.213.O._10N.222.54.F10]